MSGHQRGYWSGAARSRLGDEHGSWGFVDSNAALAVTARRGNGKLRHVKVGCMWVQELAASKEVVYRKVAGDSNPADLCTKHLDAIVRSRLLPLLGQWPRERP